MEMSEKEITARFQNAADPGKMIGVLAELNGVSPEQIRKILQRAWEGESPGKAREAREKQMLKLYQAGLTDGEIGRYVGLSRSSVQHWRTENRLPKNYGKSKTCGPGKAARV